MPRNKIVKSPIELFTKDGVSVGRFACAECKMVRTSRENAARCCALRTCSICKKPSDPYVRCEACQQVERLRKTQMRWRSAEKVDYSDFDGPVFNDVNDRYYSDIGEAIEDLWDDLSEVRLYACSNQKIHISAENLIENALDDHHEDAEISSEETLRLQAMLDEWVSRQDVETWYPNFKIGIVTDAIVKNGTEP